MMILSAEWGEVFELWYVRNLLFALKREVDCWKDWRWVSCLLGLS